MLDVSATDFQRNFGKYQDVALVQPLAITQNGRERMVLMSVEAFRQLKRGREVMRVESLTDADLAAIAAAEPPAHTRHLDSELDD